jgi:hypothetical protein
MQVITRYAPRTVVFVYGLHIGRLDDAVHRVVVNPMSEQHRACGVANAIHSLEVHLISHAGINSGHRVAVDERCYDSP